MMFYCDLCAEEAGWPIGGGVPRSRGPCECCEAYSINTNIPSRALSVAKVPMTRSAIWARRGWDEGEFMWRPAPPSPPTLETGTGTERDMTEIEQEVSEALASDPHYPLGERDAMKWAVAWRLIRDRNGIDANASQAAEDIDGWMVGWFANCMATGEMAATGGSFLNADGMQDILDGKLEARPERSR